MLISTITSNISFIQLSLMHRITKKICKERWQHWCTKISGVKVLPTLLISTITSNMSFIQLSLMLSGYPASSFCCSTSQDKAKKNMLAVQRTSQVTSWRKTATVNKLHIHHVIPVQDTGKSLGYWDHFYLRGPPPRNFQTLNPKLKVGISWN